MLQAIWDGRSKITATTTWTCEGGSSPIRYSKPHAADAGAMWTLTRDSDALDLNSPYFYLTVSQYFADTSIVAKVDHEHAGSDVVGFVAGLRPPASPDTLFVWQIGVAASHRRQGVAHDMLLALLDRLAGDGVRYLDATVTPSNEASQRMFRSLAARLGAPCEESELYPAALFPGEDHEQERRLHIGRFTMDAVRTHTREYAEQRRGG